MTTFQFIIYMVAIVLSPLIAVQVTEFLRRRKDAQERRLWIFRTLMATRAARLDGNHVQALNMIDVEFHGKNREMRDVVEAWKTYLDHLNNRQLEVSAWVASGDDLFFELLYKMSMTLKYDLQKTEIRRTSYTPQGYGDAEADGMIIRKGLSAIFGSPVLLEKLISQRPPDQPAEGKPALPIKDDKTTPEDKKLKQEPLQK